MFNSQIISVYFSNEDLEALEHVTDVSVERPADGDPRPSKIIFTFAENPFFADEKLVKEFRLKDPKSELTADFDYMEEVEPVKTAIAWKDDAHNLAAKYPQKGGPGTAASGGEDGDLSALEQEEFEPGSFFSCFFESTNIDVCGPIAMSLQDTFFPNAIKIYEGELEEDMEGMFDDSDDEEDEEDDDEEDEDDEESEEDPNAEIDLEEEEKRPNKRAKKN